MNALFAFSEELKIVYEPDMEWNIWTTTFVILYLARHGFETFLDVLQSRHLKSRQNKIPAHLRGKVSLETINKAVLYNRDKLHFGLVHRGIDAIALTVMIRWGFDWLDGQVTSLNLTSALPRGLLFFGALGLASLFWNLPAELYATFVIEERHGFNRQTVPGFIIDKLKEILVSLIVGGGLLVATLSLMIYGGPWWWVLVFCALAFFQALVSWIFPVLILPLFNKLTPVDSDIAEDVTALARKVGFSLKRVLKMDGSRRSGHSNAFFVGMGRAKRVVIYDTLIGELTRPELTAVLAHEFGHFKLKHIQIRLILSIAMLLLVCGALSIARQIPEMYFGLGFSKASTHAALVVFALFIGELLAPLGWISRVMSRRAEFAADRFAVESLETGLSLSGALVKLVKQNLSSPGSHRLFRAYYNSHPPLKARLREIRNRAAELNLPC